MRPEHPPSTLWLVAVALLVVGCAGGAPNEPTEVVPPEVIEVDSGGEATVTPQPTPSPPADTQPVEPTATGEAEVQAPAEAQAPVAQPAGSCSDDSAFVDDVTVPDGTQFTPGQSFKKTWRMSNSGTCAWTTGYRLYFFGGEKMGAPTAVSVTQNVAPGATLDISIDMIAPATPGEYTGYWKLMDSNGAFFGTTAYVEIVVTGASASATTDAGTGAEGEAGACVDDAQFVADLSVPDGTTFAPGESFTKTWQLRNNGTCTWDTGYQLTFVTGEQMGAPAAVSVASSVNPGETLDISADMTAPGASGEYTGTWRMANGDGAAFGTHPYVNIIVQ